MENSKADCCEGEVEPSVDDGGVSVIADSHATQALDPAEGALHGPADTHQSRTVRVGRERMAVSRPRADSDFRVVWLSYPETCGLSSAALTATRSASTTHP